MHSRNCNSSGSCCSGAPSEELTFSSSEALQVEVVAVEIFLVSVFSPVLINVKGEDPSLVLKNSNILVPDPVCLSLDALGEAKVHDVGLLGFDLNLSIFHFFPHGLLLPVQVLFSLHRHADLGELENDFKQDEEGDHTARHAWVGDGGE